MIEPAINSDLSKSKPQRFLEYLLLAVCLCVIALRATLTEGLASQLTSQASLCNTIYSLSLTAVLIISFIVWFIWSFCSSRFVYRLTSLEIGLCLFTIAAVISTVIASNKRAAITDFIMLIAPMLMAMLLIQILDSDSKIKLLLIVIIALGVVSAYQCAEQFFFSNKMTIEQYEQAPERILQPLGIEPGSFGQMLFEHRLYSRGVHGFFTTSNSAGSFALLASFACIGLLIEKFQNRKSNPFVQWQLLACATVLAAVLFGFFITRSKGATLAGLIAAAMFIIYLLFGNWVKAHKKVILIASTLLIAAGGCMVVWHGLGHGRLPGGNSMLVRWQYWHSSGQMFADYPLTGVGPGNFKDFYPHYKPASALESVADPHNFLLSILTQYGPLGLIGFLALVFLPLLKITSPRAKSLSEADRPEPPFIILAIIYLIIISAALRLIRPMILPIAPSVSTVEKKAAVIMLYVMPMIIFIFGFLLLTVAVYPRRNAQDTIRKTNVTVVALFCACLGLLIHNLIDFAIFEPGVFCSFWAMVAVLTALDFHHRDRKHLVLKPSGFVKALSAAGGLVVIFVFLNYAVISPIKSAAKIDKVEQAVLLDQF
ncbi:MAG: O-antigen ligase family protein, partial [Planctomycetota bacterium]